MFRRVFFTHGGDQPNGPKQNGILLKIIPTGVVRRQSRHELLLFVNPDSFPSKWHRAIWARTNDYDIFVQTTLEDSNRPFAEGALTLPFSRKRQLNWRPRGRIIARLFRCLYIGPFAKRPRPSVGIASERTTFWHPVTAWWRSYGRTVTVRAYDRFTETGTPRARNPSQRPRILPPLS
jgi:hypothetical protein